MNTSVRTIALVENDRAAGMAFQRLLHALGHAVELFDSAEGYLARSGRGLIDCLLVDVNLDGMSGLQLQAELTLLAHSPPIILMTGWHDRAVELRAREQGCAGFLYKPFDGRALSDAIDSALAAPHVSITSSRGTPC